MTEQEKPGSSPKTRDTDNPATESTADGAAGGVGESSSVPSDAGAPPGKDETPAVETETPGTTASAGTGAAADSEVTDAEGPTEGGAGTGPAAVQGDGATAPPARSSGGVAGWIALVLAVVAFCLAAYQWWAGSAAGDIGERTEQAVQALGSELRGEIGDTAGAVSDLTARLDALQGAVSRAAEESRVAALERRVETTGDIIESLPGRMQNLEEALANLQGISAGARDAWLLAEAEYYMQLANAQAQLAGNAELAAFALELADRRIRELADPAYTPVRRLLAEEITALKGVASIDVEGVSLSLASLGEIVQSLPLDEDITPEAQGRAAPDSELTGAARAWAAVKSAFSDVVRVRRSDEALKPLLSPDAQYFLRTNLGLQMQTARLALLKGEDEVFRQSLDDAEAWLRRYFDNEDQAVMAAIATIAEIRASDISAELPDISGSLRLFRQQRRLAEEAG